MAYNKNFDVAEHLPLKDFLTHLSSLSDTIEPEMEEMHKIINRTEALEFEFAFRLENLKMTLLTPKRGKVRGRQLSQPEKEIVKLASMYKMIYEDKERMRTIRDNSSEMINKEFLILNPEAEKNRDQNTPGTSSGLSLNAAQPIPMTEEETAPANNDLLALQVTKKIPNDPDGAENKMKR